MIAGIAGLCALFAAMPAAQLDSKPGAGAKSDEPKIGQQSQGKKDGPGTGADASVTSWQNDPQCQEALKKFRSGGAEEAKRLLDLAAAKNPEFPPAQVMLAVMFITNNQASVGRNLLERAAVERPDHPEVHTHFGEVAIAENRLSDAEVQFDRATQLAGNERWSLKQRQSMLSHAYAGLAAVAERRGDWDTAYAKLYLLAQLENDNPRVAWRLGRSLFFRNKPEEALAKFQQAHGADKTLEPPELTMGGLWNQKKDFAKAEQWLTDAVKKYSQDLRTHTSLATFHLDQGRVDNARAAVKSGLQVDPGNAPLRLLDALVARSAGELDYAERTLQELVSKFPSDFSATNQLALVLADQDDARKKAQALDIANNNQKLHQNNVEAITTLGWALFRNGIPDRAEQALSAAVRSGQASSDAAYFLGVVMADKKKEDAKKLFELALAAPGTFVHRKDCEEALKKLDAKPAEKKQ
jgi:Tfp pilus assembly protein PilF